MVLLARRRPGVRVVLAAGRARVLLLVVVRVVGVGLVVLWLLLRIVVGRLGVRDRGRVGGVEEVVGAVGGRNIRPRPGLLGGVRKGNGRSRGDTVAIGVYGRLQLFILLLAVHEQRAENMRSLLPAVVHLRDLRSIYFQNLNLSSTFTESHATRFIRNIP